MLRQTSEYGQQSTRGCGGVAILWKENLSVTPVRSVDSDRFVAIQLLLASSTLLSIVAVYLPSSDHPMSEFTEYLVQLESLISSLQASGPVMVVGDFNAHLGSLGCHRNSDNTNRAGHMLFDVICRCSLFVASQSAFADGECYTFENGSHKTTVDYCLVDSGYAHLLKSCSTLSPDPLNLSDHLPLRVSLDVFTTKFTTPKSPPALNWQQAVKEGSVQGFEENVSCFLSEILRRLAPLSTDELDNEITLVCHSIPVKERGKKKAFYQDRKLKLKCIANKSAWKFWNNAGRPRCGPVFDHLNKQRKI